MHPITETSLIIRLVFFWSLSSLGDGTKGSWFYSWLFANMIAWLELSQTWDMPQGFMCFRGYQLPSADDQYTPYHDVVFSHWWADIDLSGDGDHHLASAARAKAPQSRNYEYPWSSWRNYRGTHADAPSGWSCCARIHWLCKQIATRIVAISQQPWGVF